MARGFRLQPKLTQDHLLLTCFTNPYVGGGSYDKVDWMDLHNSSLLSGELNFIIALMYHQPLDVDDLQSQSFRR